MQKEKLMNIIESKKKGVYRNISWQTQLELLEGSKPVVQYDLQGNLIKSFNTIDEAAAETGMSTVAITKLCRGTLKHNTSNYTFEYGNIPVITKITTTVCRLGVKYSHISSVIEMNAVTGKINKLDHELPWGTWENQYLIAHNDKSYLRITKSRSPKHKTVVSYYKNGVKIAPNSIQNITKSNNWGNTEDTPIFAIDINNILSLDKQVL